MSEEDITTAVGGDRYVDAQPYHYAVVETDREIRATFDREGGATWGSGVDSKNGAHTLMLLGTR